MLGKALLTAATGMMAGGEALGVEDVFSTFLYTGNDDNQSIVNGIALADGVVIAPGTALGGGFFAGFISATADGVATHALIVAPSATGATGGGYTLTTDLQWKTSQTSTANTTSPFDGAANTAAMIAAGAAAHPAAQFCDNLTIGGFNDWYLPARYELDIAYFNLKPNTSINNTSWGINNYSVPKRNINYNTDTPAQTSIAAFQVGGGEDFITGAYWSSTAASASNAWTVSLANGSQLSSPNDLTRRVRAFRKIAINDPALDPYRVTGEGGLFWLKRRVGTTRPNHYLFDTNRGGDKYLRSNTDEAEFTNPLVTFNPDGVSLADNANTTDPGISYVSWTFRKAPKFFDIVTYTGTGSARTIAHNLGSVPGCIIIKRTDAASEWVVYHRSLSFPQKLRLNTTNSAVSASSEFTNTPPTSSVFNLGTASEVNASGGTYVAYIFAHDAGGFGDDGNDSVIKCGSYTGNGSTTGPVVNLGWEPQWLVIKRTDTLGGWFIFDSIRGITTSGNDPYLRAESDAAEFTTANDIRLEATGFGINSTSGSINASGGNFIYIAIRRGPMKTPTSGTEVFSAITRTGTGGDTSVSTVGFAPDLVTAKGLDSRNNVWFDRIRGTNRQLASTSTAPEYTDIGGTGSLTGFDLMNGYRLGSDSDQGRINQSGVSFVNWNFRRAPGFFDVVAYTGTGSAQSIAHNLGVAPELMIVKNRGRGLTSWYIYSAAIGNTKILKFDSSPASIEASAWNNTSPTNTVFTVGSALDTNQNNDTYIAYLFATVPGVSKVGSYTGTGTTLNIDCGFTNGARFVLIKRTDSSGNWRVWDTVRGIVSGNDPLLNLNLTNAEDLSTDWIDPLSSGFQLSGGSNSQNQSGGSYIFLAIA